MALTSARLGLEDGLDEVVDGVARDDVGDVDRARLTDPVRPVFRLPVVGRHPVQIVEHDLRRGGQVESRSARDDVGDEDADFGIVLEPIDQRLPLAGRRLPGYDDRAGPSSFASFCMGSSKHEKTMTFSP